MSLYGLYNKFHITKSSAVVYLVSFLKVPLSIRGSPVLYIPFLPAASGMAAGDLIIDSLAEHALNSYTDRLSRGLEVKPVHHDYFS